MTALRATGTIKTYTGQVYDFQNPTADSITLEDIAHATSNTCRFTGHTKRFYSVAEHAVLCSHIIERQGGTKFWQMVALFHDAHEAYVHDMPRPLKPLMPSLEGLSSAADEVIVERFGLHSAAAFKAARIKHADDIALVTEARELMQGGVTGWTAEYQALPSFPSAWRREVFPWARGGGQLGVSPRDAEDAFVQRVHELHELEGC